MTTTKGSPAAQESLSRGVFYRRMVSPILDLLRLGVSPGKMALSIALGVVLGVTPILGSTTLLCAVAAVLLRLNLPAIQIVNWFVYPLQLALIIPFLHMGSWLFGSGPVPYSLGQILDLARSDPGRAVAAFGMASLRALAAWAACAAVAAALIYCSLAPVLRRISAGMQRWRRSPVRRASAAIQVQVPPATVEGTGGAAEFNSVRSAVSAPAVIRKGGI